MPEPGVGARAEHEQTRQSAETAKLRILQFNTLAKHLAEPIQFPYAIDVACEKAVDRGSAYESWDQYGVTEKHWLYEALSQAGTPAEYLLEQSESGTFGVEKSGGKYIYAWSERLPQLASQIDGHDPDIIFLEEVEVSTVPDFARHLGADIQAAEDAPNFLNSDVMAELTGNRYAGVYAAQSESATSLGIAMLWKKSCLMAAPGESTEVLRYSASTKIALFQRLRFVESGVAFVAAATHLHWNPVPREGRATLQEQEAAELVAALEAKGRPLPVLLGGDFNCGRQNRAYLVLASAGLQDLGAFVPEAWRHRFTMHVPRAPVPKLTDARHWHQPAITEKHPVLSDYIFARGITLLAVDGLDTGMHGVPPYEPSATNGLPHKSFSASDHFPIAYDVVVQMQRSRGTADA